MGIAAFQFSYSSMFNKDSKRLELTSMLPILVTHIHTIVCIYVCVIECVYMCSV
jgi:hypothetical protein